MLSCCWAIRYGEEGGGSMIGGRCCHCWGRYFLRIVSVSIKLRNSNSNIEAWIKGNWNLPWRGIPISLLTEKLRKRENRHSKWPIQTEITFKISEQSPQMTAARESHSKNKTKISEQSPQMTAARESSRNILRLFNFYNLVRPKMRYSGFWTRPLQFKW